MAEDEPPKRRRRGRTYLLIALALLVVVGALAAVKYAQISRLMAFGKHAKAMGPPPETVSTGRSAVARWESTLSAVGTVSTVDAVNVTTEAPGLVKRITFESGQRVTEGQVLVELDVSSEQAQLDAAKARAQLAQIEYGRSKELVDKGAVPRNELDSATSTLQAANADVAALEAQITKKTIRSPFTGKLGIRTVTVGQYLAPGTAVTTLDTGEIAHIDFTLPQQQVGNVHVGMPVRVAIHGGQKLVDGKISAIDPTVEGGTRNVRLRAELPKPGTTLSPGMYGEVTVVLPERPQLVIVPSTAVVHASYGDSVFVVEPKPAGSPGMDVTPEGKQVKLVRQMFVRLGTARGDFVAITEGLEPNVEVVTAGAFKLRNGAPVVVDNSVQAQPQLAPHVENR